MSFFTTASNFGARAWAGTACHRGLLSFPSRLLLLVSPLGLFFLAADLKRGRAEMVHWSERAKRTGLVFVLGTGE
jgi:hypothetical protein